MAGNDTTEMSISAPCPVCGKRELVYRAVELKIPHFGRCLETTIFCRGCGFKHSDIMMLEVHEPMRYEIKIEEEKDLNAKIVRSTSGTITIPEIGAKLEPGPYSEAFITNIEGVLNRFVDILLQLLHTHTDKRKNILSLMRKIGYIRHGKMKATLILDDPFGNSAIIAEKVKKRKLRDEEIKKLKTGEIDIEIDTQKAGKNTN